MSISAPRLANKRTSRITSTRPNPEPAMNPEGAWGRSQRISVSPAALVDLHLKSSRHPRTSASAALQAGQGAPAPPQVKARDHPWWSGWVSQTQPTSSLCRKFFEPPATSAPGHSVGLPGLKSGFRGRKAAPNPLLLRRRWWRRLAAEVQRTEPPRERWSAILAMSPLLPGWRSRRPFDLVAGQHFPSHRPEVRRIFTKVDAPYFHNRSLIYMYGGSLRWESVARDL